MRPPRVPARTRSCLALLCCVFLPSALTAQVPAAARDALVARADSLRAEAVALAAGGQASASLAVSAFRAEIAAREQLDAASRLRELATAWNLLGHVYQDLAQYDSSHAVYRRALALREQAGDVTGVAASTNNIGNVHLALGRTDSALVYYGRALAIHRARGDRPSEALVLRNMAVVHRDGASRDPRAGDRALPLLREALAIHRALGSAAEPRQLALTLEDIGDHHDATERPDSATVYWRAALEVVTADSLGGFEAGLRYGLAALHDQAERLDSAHHEFQLAAAAAARDGDLALQSSALQRIGNLYMQRGQSDSAVAYLDAAIGLARYAGDSALLGDNLLQLAMERRISGRFALAAGHVEEALRAHRAVNNREGEAAALEELGRYFDRTARRDSAVVRLNEALAIRRSLGDQQREVATLLLLAQALRWRHPDEFRALADSARAVYQGAHALAQATGRPRVQASVATSLAAFHDRSGMKDSARAYAREALVLARRTGDVLGESNAFRLIGVSFGSVQPDSALAYLDSALVVAERVGAVTHQRTIHADAGELLLGATDASGARRVAEGIARLQRALELARRTAQPLDVSRALQFIGHAHKLAEPARWIEAAAYYDSSWAVLDGMREQAGSDAARIAFAEEHGNASRHLSAAWTQVARQTGAQADLRRALAAAERGRARALLDLRGSAAQALVSGPLDAVADTLLRRIRRPGTAALTYFVGADTTVATLLRPTGMIVAYTIPASSDSVVAMVATLRRALDVDSAAVRAAPIALETPSDPVSRGLGLGAASSPGAPSVAASLARVSDYVIPAALRQALIEDAVSELVIVPDGPLAVVPFAALPFDSAGTPLGIGLRLRLAPSLVVLADAEARSTPSAAGATIVVGNPAMPLVEGADGVRVQLSDLPGAGAEAAQVAQALGSRVRMGDAASEAAIRLALPSAAIVHLATHGYAFASEHRVRDSFVALAPGSGHDGLLTVGEVLDEVAPLQADLIVLSACQTALGSSTNTEGTVGLQRAFLARGARSLLVSLWSVDDAVTQRMMVRFYHHWLAGASKAEALRRAQADIRATHPNPRYWAAFQLVGAG